MEKNRILMMISSFMAHGSWIHKYKRANVTLLLTWTASYKK